MEEFLFALFSADGKIKKKLGGHDFEYTTNRWPSYLCVALGKGSPPREIEKSGALGAVIFSYLRSKIR